MAEGYTGAMPVPEQPRVRPLRPADFAAVAEVAYDTGFFGESAARYFPDAALFGDLWAGPYFVGTPLGRAWVFVVRGCDEGVTGIFGSPGQRRR